MKIAVLGSALRGGGIQVVDALLESYKIEDLLIYDDNPDAHGLSILGAPVIGSINHAICDYSNGLFQKAVVAIGSVIPRKKIYENVLSSGVEFINVVSSRAFL